MKIAFHFEQSIESQDITSDEDRITIKSLFKDYNGDYKPAEIDWGPPKGNEI